MCMDGSGACSVEEPAVLGGCVLPGRAERHQVSVQQHRRRPAALSSPTSQSQQPGPRG